MWATSAPPLQPIRQSVSQSAVALVPPRAAADSGVRTETAAALIISSAPLSREELCGRADAGAASRRLPSPDAITYLR